MKPLYQRIAWKFLYASYAFCFLMILSLRYAHMNMKRECARLQQSLHQEEKKHQSLQAEWHYLNRPERVHDLAKKAHLHPLEEHQILKKTWDDSS